MIITDSPTKHTHLTRILPSVLILMVLGLLLVLLHLREEIADVQYVFTLEDAALSPHYNDPRARVVVSMTTFADRIFITGMHAIRSVLAQRQPHDRFIITIPVRGTRDAAPPSATAAICANHFHDCLPLSVTARPAGLNLTNTTSVVRAILAFLEAPEQGLGGRFAPAPARPPTDGVGRTAVYENARRRMTLQFLLDGDPYGPATKVLGALLLERDPHTVIITVDDDIAYDPSLLQVLSTHIPAHAALCPACQTRSLLSPDTHKGMIHDGSWHRWLWAHNAKACPGWLVGWAGVAYRVGYFGPDVFNTATHLMPAACLLNDDVWLSGYLRRRGVELLVMPGIRGGKNLRHPTLSLSVRPDYERTDMDPCIRFWEAQPPQQ